jgi:hypothetical protein
MSLLDLLTFPVGPLIKGIVWLADELERQAKEQRAAEAMERLIEIEQNGSSPDAEREKEELLALILEAQEAATSEVGSGGSK